MRVLFTHKAEKDFNAIKEFINIKWGSNTATAFEQKVIDFADILKDFP